MAISEQLQTRIANLTGAPSAMALNSFPGVPRGTMARGLGPIPGGSGGTMARGLGPIPGGSGGTMARGLGPMGDSGGTMARGLGPMGEAQMMARGLGPIPGGSGGTHTMPDGTSMPGSDHAAYQDMLMRQGDPVMPPQDMLMRQGDPMGEAQMMQEMQAMSPEDQARAQHLLQKGQMAQEAPLASLAAEIKAASEGEDTELAHLRPGEIVIPPEFLEDSEFESILERKFNEFDINPEEAVAGMGIASLNATTGLEQFGFFKKLGKNLKKVVKKVAPLAVFIPGIGTALGGALGGLGGLATSGLTKIGLGGIAGTLGSVGSSIMGGIGGLGIPGLSSIAGGTAGGFGGIMGGLTNPLAGGMFGKTGSSFAGGPSSGKGLANRFGMGSGTPGQVAASSQAQQAQQAMAGMTPAQIAANPQGFAKLQQMAASGGGSVIGNLLGGGGGGGGGINAGMAAMAALYGKAVKEDYKKKEGGMSDVRQSIRPDLMPQQTFQGFDLGVRKNAAMGGFQELDMRMGGPSIGPGTGTSDDIPAMLSDGEFVQTAKANNGLGGFKVTKTETGIEMIPNGKPSRKKGAKNMDTLMKMFENYNDIGRV